MHDPKDLVQYIQRFFLIIGSDILKYDNTFGLYYGIVLYYGTIEP